MISIKLNEKNIQIESGTTIDELVSRFKPDSDVKILNGFPVDNNSVIHDGDTVVLIKKGENPNKDELESLMIARHTPGIHQQLKTSSVGIAGLGGLGSHVALSLARVGIGRLVLIDYDVVEPSNLNRQQYFIKHIGKYKTEALTEIINSINPFLQIDCSNQKITEQNIPALFSDVDVIVEALDIAETKAMFIENVLIKLPDIPIVSGNGMAGYGYNNMLHTRQLDKLYICGDEQTEAKVGRGLMAPRVGIVANMQANQVMEIICGVDPSLQTKDYRP